jgi:transposase-like protein
VAQQQQNTPIDQVLELLTEQGTDGLAEAIRLLLNAAMLFEQECFLGAAPYKRTSERRDYTNSFKPKRLRYRRCATRTSTLKLLNVAPVLSGR